MGNQKCSFIPYGRQSVNQDDIDAVTAVLQSDFLTTGPMVTAFENAVAERVQADHAIACSSGTAALHIAMLACGIGPGDKVVTSPNTFLASANCAAFVGATPYFCDIDPKTGNLDPNLLEDSWQPGTKAVIPVDFAGHPADMEAIHTIAKKHGAYVIEDACHSFGGHLKINDENHPIGGHPYADFTMFSFHPVKNLTTGEGGMLTTNNSELAKKARSFANHCYTTDNSLFQNFGQTGDPLEEIGRWSYEMHNLGYNYRLTDFQGALGLSQLKRLDTFLQRRREIHTHYNQAFANTPHITTPAVNESHADPNHIAWHLYPARIDFHALGQSRSDFMTTLAEKGVGTQVHYIPVHLQPFYRQTYATRPGDHPQAEARYQQALSLPCHPNITTDQLHHVSTTIHNALTNA